MSRRRKLALVSALLCGTLLASCSADRHARAEPDPPVYESRTGVPILMDLPIVGFLFGRRTVVR